MLLTGGWLDYGVVFLAGVLVSFTPCVYPVLPVLAAVVAGANVSRSRLTGFFLSLVYVLGMASSYSLLAVFAAISGQMFGRLQNTFWPPFIAGNLLLLFALVMFDVLPLPSFVIGRRDVRGRGVWPLFVMGFVSGFILSPCTAPVLGSLLVLTASRENIFFSVSLLFVFALGMGVSLLLAGTFSGFLASLPKSGQWMVRVRKLLAFVLLGLAEWFLLRAGQFFF